MADADIVHSLIHSCMDNFNYLDVALSDFPLSCQNWSNWDAL